MCWMCAQALRVATQNIELNDLVQRCFVQELDFRDPSSIRREAFSIALGADILCAPYNILPPPTFLFACGALTPPRRYSQTRA